MEPRWLKMEPRWLKMAPRWAKMVHGARLAHLGARLAHLGARKAHPGACCRVILWSGKALGSQGGPRWSQESAKIVQDGAEMALLGHPL